MSRSAQGALLGAVLVAGGVLGVLGAGCGGGAAARRPHLFLVTVDTLRADHLSLYGYGRETSPEVDAFGRAAWTFTQGTTVIPKTGPSFTTHLSGLYPAEHRVTANRFTIPEDVRVVAEDLAEAGYRNVAFVSNPVLDEEKGYARGFERYSMYTKTGGLDALNADFARFCGENDWDRPTFVWVHYIDPHGPYTPPEDLADVFEDEAFHADQRRIELEYERLEGWPKAYVRGALPGYQRHGDEDRFAYYISRYDAEIRYMDRCFGELLDELRDHGIWDESAILFTADHGESLDEHDYFFEHGWFVYEPTVHIPFVLKPPGVVEPRVIETQVSNLDTRPTLLDLAGLVSAEELPGASLLRLPAERGALLLENCSRYPDLYRGLREPGWKFVERRKGGDPELYDLRADPREEHNLAVERADELEDWRARLRELVKRARGTKRAKPREVKGGAHAHELSALGYAEGDEDADGGASDEDP